MWFPRVCGNDSETRSQSSGCTGLRPDGGFLYARRYKDVQYVTGLPRTKSSGGGGGQEEREVP